MRSIAILLMLAGCTGAQPQGRGLNFYSLEREISLGRQLAGTLDAQVPPVADAGLQQYVARLGTLVAAQAEGKYRYTFTLFDDRKPWVAPDLTFATPSERESGEPIAVAGGAVFVPLTLLINAPDESTFAFHLAHAIAHISLRHATRNATRAELVQIGTAQVQRVQAVPGNAFATPLAELAFARASEREADFVAIQFLAAAGFDPNPVIPYLAGLPRSGNTALDDHPTGLQRSAAVRQEVEKLAARTYTAGTGEFLAMQARAANR